MDAIEAQAKACNSLLERAYRAMHEPPEDAMSNLPPGCRESDIRADDRPRRDVRMNVKLAGFWLEGFVVWQVPEPADAAEIRKAVDRQVDDWLSSVGLDLQSAGLNIENVEVVDFEPEE